MKPKIYPIFSQTLENGQSGEFGVGEDGKAYWNGKPVITEEKVVLQVWVNIAIIVSAIAVIGQMVFAALTYFDAKDARTADIKAMNAQIEHWKGVALDSNAGHPIEQSSAVKNGNVKELDIPRGATKQTSE